MTEYIVDTKYIVGQMRQIDILKMYSTELPVFPKLGKEDRSLCYVNYLDQGGGFAFLITNGYGIDKEGQHTKIKELYVNLHPLKSNVRISEGDWVTCTIIPSSVLPRDTAVDVKRLEFTKEEYTLACNYTGQYSMIEGDIKRRHISIDVLSSVKQVFLQQETGKDIVFQVDKIRIDQLAQQNLTTDLYALFKSDKDLLSFYFSEDTPRKYISNGKGSLWTSILPILYKIDKEKGEELLSRLTSDEVSSLFSSATMPEENLTFDLRLILSQKLDDAGWIRYIPDSQYNDFIAWLFGKDDQKVGNILMTYFAYRDEAFCEEHTLFNALDKQAQDRLQGILLDLLYSDIVDVSGLRRYTLNYYVKKDISFIYKARTKDVAVNEVYPEVVKWLNDNVESNEKDVRKFLLLYMESDVTDNSFNEIFVNSTNISDSLYAEMFSLTGNVDYLNDMEDFDSTSIWLGRQSDECIIGFLTHYGAIIEESEDIDKDEDSYIKSIDEDSLARSMKSIEVEEQYRLLQCFPQEYACEFVTKHLSRNRIYKTFIGEIWERTSGAIPFATIDLESDGERINSFAICTDGITKVYTGEEQLADLGYEIANKRIVVGHNIKQWDLPILACKGMTTDNFVWDTLEIEILLNPCRYAYSLRTTHIAKDDAELTTRLFWNQLYRLSKDRALCKDLERFLPGEINTILNTLQKEYFSKYFEKTSNIKERFFQELRPLDGKLLTQLNEISNIPNDEQTLIIAPKDIWPRIAQMIAIEFPCDKDEKQFQVVSREELSTHPFDNDLLQTVLLRFCDTSKTPIVGNIAQYLRIDDGDDKKIKITDEVLEGYLQDSASSIDCIDIDGFESNSIISNDYKHIFIIGSEIQDRVHKSLMLELTFDELVIKGCQLPLSMASTNYAPLTEKDAERLGLKKSNLTANYWAERKKDGTFAIYQNYKYQTYRNAFLSHFKVKPIIVPWKIDGEQKGDIILTQARSNPSKTFTSSLLLRVNANSTQRAKYWVYQWQMVDQIHKENPHLPIIYIVNSSDEREELIAYAAYRGYYVPKEGSGFRKLEYIGSRPNGLVIITKEQFTHDIGSYRTDKPYCFVWDNMDIDRYMLMWDELPFDDDPQEGDEGERDEKSHGTTAKQCIMAAWPIFDHYCSLAMANSAESKFYLIDPHFDDYSDIAQCCDAKSYKVDLWQDEETYGEELAKAKTTFKDSTAEEMKLDVVRAMDILRQHFIPEGKDWYDYQKNIMPHILEKKNDCIVSLPTGGGKSVLFQAPAIYHASRTHKLSLVITPLRALMQDQVEELQKKGFAMSVDYLSGDRMYPETKRIYRRITSGEIALLYITPERFRVRSFMNVLSQRMELDKGLEYIIFDEAHCISQWGQDFRPDYRNAVVKAMAFKKVYELKILMFSATVTSQVEADLRHFLPEAIRLGQDAEDYNPIRQHISVSFETSPNEVSERVEYIAKFIEDKRIDFDKSCMIVFCRTHKQCEETSEALENLCSQADANSILAKCIDHIGYYHAGLDATQRNDIYEAFKSHGEDKINILCTTKAFGMGMDIPNIHYVIHLNPPAVMEDYLQEVGRAGRDADKYKAAFKNGDKIPAVCIYSEEDFRKLKVLLVKSQMSWSDLEIARTRIVEYIKRFKPLEEANGEAVVVPYDVWVKDESPNTFNDATASRLAFHWLEHIGCIKQGYLDQASLSVTKTGKGTACYTAAGRMVLSYINEKIVDNDKETLLSIKDMRLKLKMSLNKIMDGLLECDYREIIELNETMRCELRPRRFYETHYMVEKKQNIFALHIIMEGLRKFLSTCKSKEERTIGQEERAEMCRHLMDDVVYEITEYTITKKNGNKETIKYMPWWNNETSNHLQGAVTKAETFRKDIITRTGERMFSILEYVPNVTITRPRGSYEYQIKVKGTKWKQFLTQLEEDCLNWLEFVCNQSGRFNWPKALIELELTKKGFDYFQIVLTVLKILLYTESSPLIRSGVEIYANETSDLPIADGKKEDSPMHQYREDFDEQERVKKVRLAAINVFAMIDGREQTSYIKRYFQCKDFGDYMQLVGDYAPENSDILSELAEEALTEQENKLKDNKDQLNIYEQPRTNHVNVLAGPGSGKTHVLTLRCARLIYKEHIDPSHLLVLAYNRSVVIELRNRLDRLFTKLGLSKMAKQLHVYTFAALCKVCMGNRLNNVPVNTWESWFLSYIKNNHNEFRARFGNIEFVLVDEFQDINQERLETLMEIHSIFENAKFFTIGDINQSIYGFNRVPQNMNLVPSEYSKRLKPEPYYDALDKHLHPVQLKMYTNYRSYQKILDMSKAYISNDCHSAAKLMEHEPKEEYTFVTDNVEEPNKPWFKELPDMINWAKRQNKEAMETGDSFKRISTIAVFFRTNNEVYRGFSRIKKMVSEDVRIRIQGASTCELWREREIYDLVHQLYSHPNVEIVIKGDKTALNIKRYLQAQETKHPSWDRYMLDIAYTLVLNYIDSIRADEVSHTWSEMGDYIKDIAGVDDGGQVYKVYDQYKDSRIIQDEVLTIVLTTMHKVKGLEFDAVIIAPSFANLPLRFHRQYLEGETPQEDDLADMDEERRLLYVAYTRAKKYLHAYKGEREKALDENVLYQSPSEQVLGYAEKNSGLDNYNIGFNAGRFFSQNSYIVDSVKKKDPISIYHRKPRENGNQYPSFEIMHQGICIGQLSRQSNIRQQMEEYDIDCLEGFFVSEVFVWTYEDTLRTDQNLSTDYARNWCEAARQKGYIYIVNIAGFGHSPKQ